jgi:hypothetical protein
MTESAQTITIDGEPHEIASLSEGARAQIANIQFADAQIQQLNNELAIADTARLAYANALKRELAKT